MGTGNLSCDLISAGNIFCGAINTGNSAITMGTGDLSCDQITAGAITSASCDLSSAYGDTSDGFDEPPSSIVEGPELTQAEGHVDQAAVSAAMW